MKRSDIRVGEVYGVRYGDFSTHYLRRANGNTGQRRQAMRRRRYGAAALVASASPEDLRRWSSQA